ncbi:SET domain-containing protein [Capsaspora owczarzaki ATCC 30864]|uniref:SET domain-containing protein n=1 Tax=Capsaspora owczarzaki (strain ATCC 30864) TaxID=595528 RepID=A0A0D2WWA0_CAPO3|nr:SET domain-containing protein [Capsaspora owczarzaki ATCC 30864]KJE97240.1 SET domain-containing protein [Capsaspora owczarzaki ATCC 30864]|eukprot:XP_004343555.1 SET domain-containing protein [Capsaspora owczarzaki ATCC 30864]
MTKTSKKASAVQAKPEPQSGDEENVAASVSVSNTKPSPRSPSKAKARRSKPAVDDEADEDVVDVVEELPARRSPRRSPHNLEKPEPRTSSPAVAKSRQSKAADAEEQAQTQPMPSSPAKSRTARAAAAKPTARSLKGQIDAVAASAAAASTTAPAPATAPATASAPTAATSENSSSNTEKNTQAIAAPSGVPISRQATLPLPPVLTPTSSFERRSMRQCSSEVKRLLLANIQQAIRIGNEDHLEVYQTPTIGFGIKATRDYERSDYVCEYAGDLIDISEAKRRNEEYMKDESIGCYMYFFQHKETRWCVDATHSTRKGRLINHSKTDQNLLTRILTVDDKPRLVFFATKHISRGDALWYDYGERNAATIAAMPWLAQ